MFCNQIADLFSGISAVISSQDGEETALRIFVVVLLTVNQRKTLPIVFHNGIGVITTFDDAQKKLLFGVVTIKKTDQHS